MKLNVNNYIHKSQVEGLGTRFVIWLQGCSIACKGCFNQAMISKEENLMMDVDEILMEIKKVDVLGVTILGGEPFDQVKGLHKLVMSINSLALDIILFTGYTLEQLTDRADDHINEIIKSVDVLIDGPFIKELPIKHEIIGSSNQRIHVFNKRYEYLNNMTLSGNQRIEVRISKKGIITVNGMASQEMLSKIRRLIYE